MPRKTPMMSRVYECVGGPFDGDAVACEENCCIEVSWSGRCQGHYVARLAGGDRVLHWVPLEE
jgi:hypothetical protein